jgi:hypothetical protein
MSAMTSGLTSRRGEWPDERRVRVCVADFEPLEQSGRDEHNAQALAAYASPAHEALWKVLFSFN